jgi:hypothetical protein
MVLLSVAQATDTRAEDVFGAVSPGITDGVEKRRGWMSTTDLWTYRDTTIGTANLTGYKVEAVDGSIGSIDEATNEVGASYIVIDTGPWIFGKKVMLPAGIVDRVDSANETVFVNRTKDEIKDAPEFDESSYRDEQYREELNNYYGPGGSGYRDIQ